MVEAWFIQRNTNMTSENVLRDMMHPDRWHSAGNPAAIPSALQDWGYWDSAVNAPTQIGQLLIEGRLLWHESAIVLLSKRSAQNINPFTVLSKAVVWMFAKEGFAWFDKESIARLMSIDQYDGLTDDFMATLHETHRFSNGEMNYADIWLNALVGATLLVKCGGRYEVPRSASIRELFSVVADNGSRISPCPIKRGNISNYVSFMGSINTGICEILSCANQDVIVRLLPNLVLASKQNPECKSSDILQLIAYGAPGTGKSHGIKRETAGQKVFRTTFHPDSDYASFVGAYKPVMKDDGVAFTEVMRKETGSGQFSLVEKRDQKKGIAYEFVEQVFLKAYVEAWRRKAGADATERVPPVFLVIEEINRGNCAQVFGDVFQLLDRGDDGFSEYEIEADEDLRRHLEKRFGQLGVSAADATERVPPEVAAKLERIFKGEILLLPDNLLIRATMNTSDQSLFPIDSAFKRRWDWKYVPILEGRDENTKQPLGWKIAFDTPAGAFEFDWWEFVKRVNNVIGTTTSSEDKKLGYFFVKAERKSVDGEERLVVTAEKLLEKVVFYLWNDVFKDYGIDKIFAKGGKPVEYHCFYDSGTGEIDTALLKEFVESLPEVVK